MFFEEPLQAREARRLGAALISHSCAASRQLRLSSYDRLLPSQDSLPKGGFCNLIALPLQKEPRQRGCSVFVDDDLRSYPDQWAFLASLRRMPVSAVAFYRAQALRLSVWDKPRVIGCAESFPQHIALPRGCLQPTLTLLQGQGIRCDLQDERESGSTLNLAFIGRLRHDQCPRKGRRHGSGAGRKLVG